MRFRVDEISSVISEEIQQYRQSVDLTETGKVLEVGDGIAQVYGLSNAKSGELIAFSNGSMGQVFNLEESSVGIVILGEYLGIKEGDEVRVVVGAFANFSGMVQEVKPDKQKLKVMVSIFGRPTPVELDFTQVEKLRE